jgi:hypothetical protein
VELAGAVSRKRHDRVSAIDFAREIAGLPIVRLVTLTPDLADRAATLAADRELRGGCGRRCGCRRVSEYQCELVSLDNEHLTRLISVVDTFTPAQALARL